MAEEDEESWSLPLEVEVLESIYLQELNVCRGSSRSEPWEISITLYPATAEDQESQYVRVTLLLSVPPEYPREIPKICMRNPRGLSDEQLLSISQNLRRVADTGLGGPVLYELIEKAKEILTDNNIPFGQCVICLYGFQEGEAFTKTLCYHYFHSHCLARYACHMEEEAQSKREEKEQYRTQSPQQDIRVHCPVCREPLTYDLMMLQAAPPPHHPLEVYTPDKRTLQHQHKLRKIYEKQQAKGGIIDPEMEKNRYFISLQTPPVDENCNDNRAVGVLTELVDTPEDATKGPTPREHSGRSSENAFNSATHTDPESAAALKDCELLPTSTPQSSAGSCEKATNESEKVFGTHGQHNRRGWPRSERSGFRGRPRYSRHRYSDSHLQEAAVDQHGYFRGPPGPREFSPKMDKWEERQRGGTGRFGPRGRGRAPTFGERRGGGATQGETHVDDGTASSYSTEKRTAPSGSTEKENVALHPSEYCNWGSSRGQTHPWTQGDGRWERPRFREPGCRPGVQRPRGRREPPAGLEGKDSS